MHYYFVNDTFICYILEKTATLSVGKRSSFFRHYAELRSTGDPTLSERMEMLVQHRQALNEQIAQVAGT